MRLLSKNRTFSISWLTDDGVIELSAKDFEADVEAQKRLLVSVGIQPRDKVGVRGENSYLWIVTDVALAELDAVSVVFPPEFENRSDEELIEHYALSFMIASDARPEIASEHTNVAIMGQIDPERHQVCMHEADPYPVEDDDHSFVFSSGTSGTFKGMVISKRGVIDQINTFGDALDVSTNDRILLFMPFSSLQNRVLYYGAILRDIDMAAVPSTRLLDGLKRFQPTVLIAPPIFYEAIEKSIKAALRTQNFITRALLIFATNLAGLLRQLGLVNTSNNSLRRLYSSAHAVFGGNMRVMVTGMAKIGHTTLEFYRGLGLPLVQVYGLTECGVVCANTLANNEIGSVGKPLPGNHISITEDGEICVEKEAPQTSRFFHFEESTEDTRFENGRIYTGDLGRISDRGTLTLVGRKKSTIVGHTGVKVQPELIEKRLEESEMVATAVLVGLDAGRSLGVVLSSTRSLNDTEKGNIEQEVISVVSEMAASFKNQIRVTFSTQEFTVDSGFLTRNLKINRNAVRDHFFDSAQQTEDR